MSRPSRPDGNVVLTGFMGTGKTTVGRLLAAELGYGFVDTDAMIERLHGPIPQIFEQRGEEVFRALEREVAVELAHAVGMVVATGGRMMLDPQSREALAGSGRVFCLSADVEELIRRLSEAVEERPLLDVDDPPARIRALMEARASLYAEFEQVDTGGRSPEAITADILDRLDT